MNLLPETASPSVGVPWWDAHIESVYGWERNAGLLGTYTPYRPNRVTIGPRYEPSYEEVCCRQCGGVDAHLPDCR